MRPSLAPQPDPSPSAVCRQTRLLPAAVFCLGRDRTHTIKSGENPSIIAKEYGISIAALMAANPQAKPTHLQVGQSLNIPAP